MTTLYQLIVKVENEELTMDEAVEFAIENINPVKPHYNEDGLYLKVLEPENVIALLDGGVINDEYSYDNYAEFVTKYVQGREARGFTEIRGE